MPDPADDDYLVVVGLTAATFESLNWTKIRAAAEAEAEKVGAVEMKKLFVATASRRLAVEAVLPSRPGTIRSS